MSRSRQGNRLLWACCVFYGFPVGARAGSVLRSPAVFPAVIVWDGFYGAGGAVVSTENCCFGQESPLFAGKGNTWLQRFLLLNVFGCILSWVSERPHLYWCLRVDFLCSLLMLVYTYGVSSHQRVMGCCRGRGELLIFSL